MKTIIIKIIPHLEQRYNTVGDYWEEGQTLHFRISHFTNWRYGACVIVHELTEYFVSILHGGVTVKEIDDFDMQFEKDREEKNWGAVPEPGDDKRCPVYFGHQIATGVERVLAAVLGVDWNAYADECVKLTAEYPVLVKAK